MKKNNMFWWISIEAQIKATALQLDPNSVYK